MIEAVSVVNSLARPPTGQYHEEIVAQYGRVRRFLPKLLASIGFAAAPADAKTMDALKYLSDIGASKQRILGHSIEPAKAMAELTRQLDAEYEQVAARFDSNKSVCLDHSGKNPALTISNLDKLDEPAILGEHQRQ